MARFFRPSPIKSLLVGEDVDAARGDFLSLHQAEGKDAILVSGGDVSLIKVFVNLEI